MQTYDLLKFALVRSNGSSFLLITQYKMPFINKIEGTKRSKDRETNGQCTNGMNRRSRVFCLSVLFIFNHLRNPSAVQKGLQEKLTCPNKHLSLRNSKLGTVSSKTCFVSKQYKYKSFLFRNIGA